MQIFGLPMTTDQLLTSHLGGPSSQQTLSGLFLLWCCIALLTDSWIGQQGVEPCIVPAAGHPEPAAAQDSMSTGWDTLRLRSSNHDIGWVLVVVL